MNARRKTAVGTPLFCAPEISRGESYDESVDAYSFGLTLLAMSLDEDILEFIGMRWCNSFNKPKSANSNRLIRAMVEDGWRPVEVDKPIPCCPQEISYLVVRCCAHDPKLRPSFLEIFQYLEGPCVKCVAQFVDPTENMLHTYALDQPDHDFDGHVELRSIKAAVNDKESPPGVAL